jgi:hypothetical protein
MMPEPSALPTLVWKSGVDDFLQNYVGGSRTLHQFGDSDETSQFGDIQHFHYYHGAGWPFDVRVSWFYVQHFPNFAG